MHDGAVPVDENEMGHALDVPRIRERVVFNVIRSLDCRQLDALLGEDPLGSLGIISVDHCHDGQIGVCARDGGELG